MTDDQNFFPKILSLSQCFAQELTSAELPELCFLGIVPGDLIIADYCGSNCGGKGGMGWVRLVGVNEIAGGTSDVTGYSNCATELEAQVEVGVIRKAPTIGSNGQLPTVEMQLAAARLQYADMAAMLRAIRCCFSTGKDTKVVTYMPIGPDGDCLGGRWLISIAQHGGQLSG